MVALGAEEWRLMTKRTLHRVGKVNGPPLVPLSLNRDGAARGQSGPVGKRNHGTRCVHL